MISSRSSAAKTAGKWFLAALLLLLPAVVFFAMSDHGDSGWTAQSQIFHGGTTWIETETAKLNSVGMLELTATAEGMTVEELQANWNAGVVAENFSVADLPDTQLLKLEYTSTNPSQALRVVTAVTNQYMADASPLVNLDVSRMQLLELEEAHLEALDAVVARIETLDEASIAYNDANLSRVTLEEAIDDVRKMRDELAGDDRSTAGSELVASPFLLPQKESNALPQTLLGLALGALLACSFLLLVFYGERRSNESLAKQSVNAPEAPRASRR